MKQAGLIALILVAFADPAFAADTPRQLVEALAQAARNRDMADFVANMSGASQRALANAKAARARLVQAQQNFQDALDQQFGKGQFIPLPPPPGRATGLSRVVNIQLISVRPQTPTKVQLQLKTITRAGDGVVAEENTLAAVRERGRWKLDLAALSLSVARFRAQQASAYERITREIRDGALTDRISALIALAKAERSASGGPAR